jgi:hypothetical protein
MQRQFSHRGQESSASGLYFPARPLQRGVDDTFSLSLCEISSKCMALPESKISLYHHKKKLFSYLRRSLQWEMELRQ